MKLETKLKKAKLLRGELAGVPHKKNNCFVVGWKPLNELNENDLDRIKTYLDGIRPNKKK